MRKAIPTTGLWAGCVLLAVTGTLFAQDWPQWRGAGRDGKAAGFTAPAAWPAQLKQTWSVALGQGGDGTPALVGDKLYAFIRDGGDEAIVCLEAATGKEVWRDKYPTAPPGGPDRPHAGPRSSPAIADGKILTLGLNGTVSCLDTAGKVLWRKETAKEGYASLPRFHTAMSPVIADGLGIVQLGGDGGGAIIAYDMATGEAKWKWAGEGAAYASPVVGTLAGVKQLVTITEKSAVGVALADGKLLWQVPFAPAGMRGYNASTPILTGDMVILSGGGRGVKAFTIEKAGDALAAKPGWSNADLAPQFGSAVLKDGFLYCVSAADTLYCLNTKTGATAWIDPAKRGKGGYGEVVDAGTVLVALGNAGDMVVFQPTDKAFTEVAHFKVSDKATYAYPILAGKRIYVKDQENLILYTLE
jgi:outer membrane protein assembly factor BamB